MTIIEIIEMFINEIHLEGYDVALKELCVLGRKSGDKGVIDAVIAAIDRNGALVRFDKETSTYRACQYDGTGYCLQKKYQSFTKIND